MKVAVLGLGEAGSTFASAFVSAGWVVSGFDPGPVGTPAGVSRVDRADEAVAGADVVVGLTTAKFAVAVAKDVVGSLADDAVYVDVNAGSPQLKLDVAAVIGDSRFVDGALIGSVRQHHGRGQVLLAGSRADRAAEFLREMGSDARPIGDEIGSASRRKLLRSTFMKGLGALVNESMQAGEVAGDVEWMREQIADALTGGESSLDRLNDGTALHASRRSQELRDTLALLEPYGGSWSVTRGALSRHIELERREAADLSTELAKVPTSALGDGGDRLGFAHASIKPVWHSPAIAGRAFTVLVSPGDNQAIHAALKQARPGDILVVAGGGHTERALMGELIAERAQKAGIIGFVTDGAVRDVSALAELGFPVWAAAISPAGPYKHGPGRLGETISLGGAVCAHGDYIVADEDGVLVVPAIQAERVLQDGKSVLEDEARRKREIRS